MKTINNSKVLILLIIVGSLIFVKIVTPYIFLSNTPRINPKFISNLKQLPTIIVQVPKKIYLALTGQREIIKTTPMINLSTIPLTQVSKGIYAGEIKDKVKYFKIVDSEIEWATMELRTKSGRIIQFQYPKSQPPIKEMLEIIKSE